MHAELKHPAAHHCSPRKFKTCLLGQRNVFDLWIRHCRYSPKSLAKPFMIAHQQYTRLYKDIGDPKQDMPAPAGTPIDPTLTSATAHTDAPPVSLPPALDATARAKARLDAFQAVFERLRTHCPYVYLHEDGSDTVETKRICRCLDIGAFFGLLEPIFTKIEKDTPSMQNLSLSRT